VRNEVKKTGGNKRYMEGKIKDEGKETSSK
jgi:hypothetical protein